MPVVSMMALLTNGFVSLIVVSSLKVSAQRQPGESQSTWATQFSARSSANSSAYQADPAYRPWLCPDHQAIFTPREVVSGPGVRR